MSKPILSPIKDLYVINVLVMVETGPQSDNYVQLDLDERKHAQLMKLLNSFAGESGKDVIIPITNHPPVRIPERTQFS